MSEARKLFRLFKNLKEFSEMIDILNKKDDTSCIILMLLQK